VIRWLLSHSRWFRQLVLSVVILAENGERVTPWNIRFVWGYAGEELGDSGSKPGDAP
jgi:hypothetical protein